MNRMLTFGLQAWAVGWRGALTAASFYAAQAPTDLLPAAEFASGALPTLCAALWLCGWKTLRYTPDPIIEDPPEEEPKATVPAWPDSPWGPPWSWGQDLRSINRIRTAKLTNLPPEYIYFDGEPERIWFVDHEALERGESRPERVVPTIPCRASEVFLTDAHSDMFIRNKVAVCAEFIIGEKYPERRIVRQVHEVDRPGYSASFTGKPQKVDWDSFAQACQEAVNARWLPEGEA